MGINFQDKKVKNILESFLELDEKHKSIVMDKIEYDGMLQIIEEVKRSKTVSYGDIKEDVHARQKYFNKFEGFGTGIGYFDDATMGFRPGELTVIAAPSNYGKTLLALNIMAALARNTLRKSLIISMEMTPVEIGSRLFNMVEDDGVLENLIHIQTELSVNTRHIQYMIEKHQPAIVMVDHLQFLANQESGQEYERISLAVSKIKRIAIKDNIPIIIISHVAKTRSGVNGYASAQDLKGSSSIEQDADIVIMANKNKGDEENIILHLSKHRTKRPKVFNKYCMLKLDGIKILNNGNYEIGEDA